MNMEKGKTMPSHQRISSTYAICNESHCRVGGSLNNFLLLSVIYKALFLQKPYHPIKKHRLDWPIALYWMLGAQ